MINTNENKKESFAWVGQNASTGRANPTTGYMSMYGNFRKFDCRKTRNYYVDNFCNQSNPSEFAVKVNRKSGREYDLGNSVRSYNEHLDMIETLTMEDIGNHTTVY